MPWSPVPKFPEIINSLEQMGYKKEVTLEPLRKAVMLHTGIIKDNTIKQTIKAMETLEYITPKPGGVMSVWFIGKPKPKTLKQDIKEIDKTLDDLTDGD